MAEAILDEANRAETFKDFLKKEEPFEAVVVGVDYTGIEAKFRFDWWKYVGLAAGVVLVEAKPVLETEAPWKKKLLSVLIIWIWLIDWFVAEATLVWAKTDLALIKSGTGDDGWNGDLY